MGQAGRVVFSVSAAVLCVGPMHGRKGGRGDM